MGERASRGESPGGALDALGPSVVSPLWWPEEREDQLGWAPGSLSNDSWRWGRAPGKPSLAGACWAQTEDPSGCGAVNMCFGVFRLGFILFGTLWVSWTWVIISFPILGTRSAKWLSQ